MIPFFAFLHEHPGYRCSVYLICCYSLGPDIKYVVKEENVY